ncbi:hypothetical protein FRC12_016349 [Ceratobasidium sp. 428]|nr:hypothetical protein FRC12_016349 [Ceratobasidium sp. 428]
MAQKSDLHDQPTSPGSVDSPDLKSSRDSLSQNAPVKELGVPIESLGLKNRRWWQRNIFSPNPDSIATQPSVFDDPKTLEIYRPPAVYENAHRFDPSARWTWREEKVSCLLLISNPSLTDCQDLGTQNRLAHHALGYNHVLLPRSRPFEYMLAQANTDNFLDDLDLSTNDFNLGNTLFRVSFLIAELPSQLVSKRLGPDVWIPTQVSHGISHMLLVLLM